MLTDGVGVGEVGVVNIQLSIQHAILTELKLLSAKLECCLKSYFKDDGKDDRMSDEWKLVAIVIDRFCFCIFNLLFIIATLIIFRHQIF